MTDFLNQLNQYQISLQEQEYKNNWRKKIANQLGSVLIRLNAEFDKIKIEKVDYCPTPNNKTLCAFYIKLYQDKDITIANWIMLNYLLSSEGGILAEVFSELTGSSLAVILECNSVEFSLRSLFIEFSRLIGEYNG